MRGLKVAAIAAGVLITFLTISWVIGFLVEAAIAALVIAVIVLAIKAALPRRQIAPKTPGGQIPESRYRRRIPRHNTRDVDDALARLKREMDA
jgi:hypothetical protein